MNKRSSKQDLKSLYGGGLEDALGEINRENNVASIPSLEDNAPAPSLSLKHKRRSAVLKQILREGGYGDLAREVNVRNRR